MDKNALLQFQQILTSDGLHAGLIFLNQRVPHRCTVVYRLNKGDVEMVELVDKLNDPATATLPAVAYSKSFCEAVARSGPLMTTDSAREPRLDGKAYQGVISSYVGLPVGLSAGDLMGTLCHCDFTQQKIGDEEFEFLKQAALLLSPHINSLPNK